MVIVKISNFRSIYEKCGFAHTLSFAKFVILFLAVNHVYCLRNLPFSNTELCHSRHSLLKVRDKTWTSALSSLFMSSHAYTVFITRNVV